MQHSLIIFLLSFLIGSGALSAQSDSISIDLKGGAFQGINAVSGDSIFEGKLLVEVLPPFVVDSFRLIVVDDASNAILMSAYFGWHVTGIVAAIQNHQIELNVLPISPMVRRKYILELYTAQGVQIRQIEKTI